MKKAFSIILMLCILFSFASCSGNKNDPQVDNKTGQPNEYVIKGSESKADISTPDEPEKKLDSEKVYKSLTYTPEMFFGKYEISGGDEGETKYANESDYEEYQSQNSSFKLTTIPFSLKSGKNSFPSVINDVTDYFWTEAYFYRFDEEGNNYMFSLTCAYSVEKNKLTLKPLLSHKVNPYTNAVDIQFDTQEFVYDFEFKGRELTLKKGNKSVKLYSALSSKGDGVYIYSSNYAKADSPLIDNIDRLMFLYSGDADSSLLRMEDSSGVEINNAIGKFEENGLFTFTIPREKDSKTYQYVYFLCDSDGLVLTDGKNTFYYTVSEADRLRESSRNYVSASEVEKLEKMSPNQVKVFVSKRNKLFDELEASFKKAGVKADLDKTSGEISILYSDLFKEKTYELTDEGKKLLKAFIKNYTDIIFSKKYENFVASTLVEGHTATDDNDYTVTDKLYSSEIARVVMRYCYSEDTEIDTNKLYYSIDCKGCSNTKPIKETDEKVNAEKSTRVAFKVTLNIEE